MEHDGTGIGVKIRLRVRRVGLCYGAVGGLIPLLLHSWTGLLVGAMVLATGLYLAFAYLPFAAWIRRHERSR